MTNANAIEPVVQGSEQNARGRRKSTGRPRQTRKQKLLTLLRAEGGSDIATLSRKLGWQAHSTRAAITGLRKAGFGIVTEKETGRPTRYHLPPDTGPEARP